MQTFRAAGCLFSELLTSRLSSHAAASCSSVTPLEQLVVNRCAIGSYLCSRHFVAAGVCPRAPAGKDMHLSCDLSAVSEEADVLLGAGEAAGNTKLKSEDQPGDSVEAELTRVRAKRLTRAERPQYLENEDFEDEVRRCWILVCWCFHPDAKYMQSSYVSVL